MADAYYMCGNHDCSKMIPKPIYCEKCAVTYCGYSCLINDTNHSELCEKRRSFYNGAETRKAEQDKFLNILTKNNILILQIWNKKSQNSDGVIFIEVDRNFTDIKTDTSARVFFKQIVSAREYYLSKSKSGYCCDFDKTVKIDGYFPLILISNDRTFHGIVEKETTTVFIPSADKYNILLK